MSGGDELTITKTLGKAGAEALAPYVHANERLQALVLRKTKLGADGMQVLADALTQNTVLTALDVAENELKVEGAKAVAELVRCVHVCVSSSRAVSHPFACSSTMTSTLMAATSMAAAMTILMGDMHSG